MTKNILIKLRSQMRPKTFALQLWFFLMLLPCSFSLMAATTVESQTVNSDTTWSLAGSPYEVMGNITVASNVTLTIDTDVQISFAPSASLIVNGSLNAQGSPGLEIIFNRLDAQQAWGGLVVNSTTTNSLIRYANISGASNICVQLNGSSHQIHHSYISDCVTAIHVSSVSPSVPHIKNNLITDNGTGIYVVNGRAQIENNLIVENSSHGINVWSSNNARPSIRYNTIDLNGGNGIYYENSDSDSTSVLENNIISRNGIGIQQGDNVTRAYNNVWGNSNNYYNVPESPTDIGSDPLYTNLYSGDRQLSADSPSKTASFSGGEIGAYGNGGTPRDLQSIPPVVSTFSVDTTISATDTSYDNQDIVVNGATLTIDGPHVFSNLTLINSAVLTHSVAATQKLEITAGVVNIDSSSRIDLTGKGLEKTAEVTGWSGGSYGGQGTDAQGGTSNPTYGNYLAPTDYGTGGAGLEYRTSRGGGVIKLIADELILNGQLYANGIRVNDNYTGGGSGGSLWLDVGELSGGGGINAYGGEGSGAGPNESGGGGGGRIAIYYTTNVNFNLTSRVLNFGHRGDNQSIYAAPGTTYIRDKNNTVGEVWLDNENSPVQSKVLSLTAAITEPLVVRNGRYEIPDGLSLAGISGVNAEVEALGTFTLPNDLLVVDGVTLLTGVPQTWDEVRVINGGTISHRPVAPGDTTRVEYTARRIEIATGAAINVSGKGLEKTAEVTGWSGGSYGGQGTDAQGGTSNATYGNYLAPTDYGTGGAGLEYRTSRGGGVIKLIADELILNGQLYANGTRSNENYTGGGSGGSLWLDVGELSGGGGITAYGGEGSGAGPNESGGGGGGRIAIYYTTNVNFNLTSRVLNYGHRGDNQSFYAAPGTTYIRDKNNAVGEVWLDNENSPVQSKVLSLTAAITEPLVLRNGRYEIPDGMSLAGFSGTNAEVEALGTFTLPNDLLVVDGFTLISSTPQTWDEVRVINGGRLSHPAVAPGDTASVNYTARKIDIALGASVDVSGKGLEKNVDVTGWSGGSYGGQGTDAQGGTSNATYGNYLAPTDYGTGGAGNTTSTRGGGIVKLTTDELILNGQIFSNGSERVTRTGGGSGGSIWLDTIKLSGNGWLYASGISGGSASSNESTGGGGGGRIAVYYGTNIDFNLDAHIVAAGNVGEYAPIAEDGTIHTSPRNVPTLIEKTTISVFGTNPNLTYNIDNTTDGDYGTFWHGTNNIQIGATDYLAYRFDTLLSISQIDFFNNYTSAYNMGELEIQVSQNSTDGFDGDWITIDQVAGDFNPPSGDFTRTFDPVATQWLRLAMTYQGRAAHGGTPSFILSEIDFYGIAVSALDPVVVSSTIPNSWVTQPLSAISVAFLTPVDATTFTIADVNLTGPSGSIVPDNITSINPLNFTLDFNSAIEIDGVYTLSIGPNIITIAGRGMDQDRDDITGEVIDDVYVSTFAIDQTAPQAPVITSHPLSPEVTNLTTTIVTIEGSREADTAIWINGVEKVSIGTGTWSTSIGLSNGRNTIDLHAEDSAGNVSTSVTLEFLVDTVAPVIYQIIPSDGSFTNLQPDAITLEFVENESGLDMIASQLTVTRDAIEIPSTWREIGSNKLMFLNPNNSFTEGLYQINAQIIDKAGLQSEPFVSMFTVDQTAPSAPSVDPLASTTSINQVTVTGSKEAYAAINVNGTPAVANTPSTTWSYDVPLNSGDNTLSFTAVDRAGNESVSTTANIHFDNTAPGAITLVADGAGNGTSIALDWTSYDEVANGNDINQYTVLMNAIAFTNTSDATNIATLPAGTKTYNATNLNRNTTYYFAILATDTLGNVLTNVTPTVVTTNDIIPPANISNLSVVPAETQLTFSWILAIDGGNDLASYNISLNGGAPQSIASTQNSFTVTGLTPATAHTLNVTSLDNDGNESAGIELTGITLLNNPVLLSADPLNSMVDLTWTPVTPNQYIKHYAIYASETNFSDVNGLTPRLTISSTLSNARLAGLSNNVSYYIAITTVNISDGQKTAVNTLSATPQRDNTGPELSNILYGATPLIGGTILSNSNDITLVANDPSGLSRVELLIDGISVALDTNGSSNYRLPIDITSLTDGAHTLSIIAYDTLDNTTQTDITVTVALAPPNAPSINQPTNGYQTNQPDTTVNGTAESDTTVFIYNNDVEVAGPLTVGATGGFTTSIALSEGSNSIKAAAQNRGGLGSFSNAVIVTRDSSLPTAPFGTAAEAREAGQVRVSWSQPSDSAIKGYNVYRATQAFSAITEAEKLNTEIIIGGVYDDLPSSDGTYYYRVVSVNAVNSISDLSNQAVTTIDSTPPRALAIDYTPTGNVDEATGRIAPGRVDVSVIVSEALLTTPFLSITPNAGIPISIQLSRITDTEYQGSFDIKTSTPSGVAYAVFSARDKVGNRGTEIDAGASLLIDASGPTVTDVVVSPSDPIQNDINNPVTLTIDLSLDQAVKPGTQPTISYRLSAAGRVEEPVTVLTPIDPITWQVQIILPADAGLNEVETLTLLHSAVDDLDNLSTRIDASNRFQIYQGDLPPLAVPFALIGKALPGGQVELSWRAVEGANDYQVYRQAPGETVLTSYQRSTGAISFTDTTLSDGTYTYSVASVRDANSQEAISGQSNTVDVNADATIPNNPQNINIEITGAGMQLTWDASIGDSGDLKYNVYRSGETEIISVLGLTPLQTNIVPNQQSILGYVDATPNANEPGYVVTAVDASGNESLPSSTAYLNVDLLPIATLSVVQEDNTQPLISWTHNGSNIAGYDVYIGKAPNDVKVNNSLHTSLQYSDNGYSQNERFYTIVTVDQNAVESLGRSILLPQITATLSETSTIKRGVMNRLDYTVNNNGTSTVNNVRLKVDIEGRSHYSASITVAAGASVVVPVVVGGYSDLPDYTQLTTTIEITPNAGEKVNIIRNSDVTIGESGLAYKLLTESFTRGAAGQVRLSLENTSEVEIEVITALADGSVASNEMRFKLLDMDGNVLLTQPFLQSLGEGVVTLTNGKTVARIAPGRTFISAPIDVNIPLAAPSDIEVLLEIDNIHYHQGKDDQVTMSGGQASQTIPLIDTSYYGEILSITPQNSFGDQDVIISGQAVDRVSGLVLPAVQLNLVLQINGFERVFKISTDASGLFQYDFQPSSNEAGVYTVSVVHPDLVERPNQGQFTISRVLVSPTTVNLNMPRNLIQPISLDVKTGEGSTATNLHIEYNAEDQTDSQLPTGISIVPGSAINLTGKQNAVLHFTISGNASAAETGEVILVVKSDERGTTPLATVRINYQLSEANPALFYTPSYIETGLARDETVTETIRLENKGLETLNDVALVLLKDDGSPPPSWLRLASKTIQGNIAVGETREIAIMASPNATVLEGLHSFKLRVVSSNHPATDIGVFVAITQSGIGNVLIKTSDIYTATLDENGELIPGLANARIRVQNEEVLSIDETLVTDAFGEALFLDLPAGRYKYRATASNHQEVIGRFRIRPGITRSEDVFLDYNLVTVEWSVTEISIEDRYEITLNATYETDVPAAVVVTEPAGVTLPEMQPGEVFYGEFTVTNYGLIRADNVVETLPVDDGFFQFDFLETLPETLDAKQRVTIPYRVVALASLNPDIADGSATGGGCGSYRNKLTANYEFICSNGTLTKSFTGFSWNRVYGQCSGGFGGASGGSGSSISVGGTAGSGGSSYSPEYESIPETELICIDPPCVSYEKPCCDDDEECCIPTGHGKGY